MKTFLLCTVILVLAIIIKTGWHKGHKFDWRWLVVVPVILLFGWCSTMKEHETKIARQAKADSVKAAKEIEAKRAMYYVPPQQEQTSVRSWDKIPPEGIKVCLRRGWRTFPLKGKVRITDPDGGIFYDWPGEKIDVGFRSEGWYTINAEPLGSERGIEIAARWCF